MERKHFKIIGHNELRRDAESLGIINVDREALNKYRAERDLKRKVAQMIDEHNYVKEEVSYVKRDVSEVKEMLALILQKLER